jgi:uncharacterized protein YjdB
MTRTSVRSIGLRILGFALLGVLATCDQERGPTSPANSSAITKPALVTATVQGSGGITHTRLTSGNNAANQKVYTTASVFPAGNTLITVAVLSHRSSAAISPTLSGGGMTGWSMVASVDFDPISLPHMRLTIFRALSASPGSGPITITFSANVSNCQWIVSQWDGVETGGVNGAGAIVQTGSNRANAVNGLTVTLGAFGSANNVAYGVFGVKRNVVAVTPGIGFTEIDEQPSGESTASSLEAEWATNHNTINATWTTLNGGALGVEIKAAGTLVPVASVQVTPATASVVVGATVQLTATPLDSAGNALTGRTITWQSGDAGVASVSVSGLVTGVTAGSATITAASEGKNGFSSITVTPPPAVVLVGAGDIADCSSSGNETTATLLDSIPGTVFTAGDNAYPDGSAINFSQCYDPSWGRHKARTRPAPGNHDYHTSGATGYFGYYGALAGASGTGYYSYDIGEWHVISLNSNISMSAGSTQEQWLRADLAASTRQCTVAYWHHPRFSSGTQHGSATSTQPFWQALYDAGAEIVISGHEHNYERFAPQTPSGTSDPTTGIREFVAGTGGVGHYDDQGPPLPNSELFNGTTWGVLKLSLGSSTYSWEFIPVAGGTFTDSGTGSCHGRPVSSGLSGVSAVPTTIVTSDGSSVSTITVTARDASGAPVTGASVVLSATGSGNTLTQPAAPTDTFGLAVGTLSSSVAESKTITATANGVAISQAALVTVTQVPVASVAVTPAAASAPAGVTVQLTATPKDAAGNPLTNRVVTWTESDGTVAAVNRNGLVMTVGAGSATVSATSEGQSGSAAITVTTPTPCLFRTGPTITLNGLQTTAYFNTSLANNTKLDASSAQFLTGADNPVVLGGGSGACFHGAETIGQLPPSTDWNRMHDTYALQVRGIPSFTLEDTREFDYGDGITLDNNSTTWTIRGVHFKYMRDDCVQNDWLNGGIIDSSYFEGCYVGISARPFATTQDGSDNLVIVKHSLFWLQDMDQGYDAPGHGGFFKWSSGGPMVSLYNNVYRVDSRSSLGTHTLGPPTGKLHGCANNVMIWLGAGPFPESLPSCYTLLTGAAGLAYWNNAVTSWKTNHANVLSDVGPPIVSLYSPLAGTTLIGTVNLTATAVDDRAVVGVQFRLNGQDIGPEVTTESPTNKFTLSWDSHGLPDGSYTLSAIARDASGHTTTSPGLAVAINNTVSAARSVVAASPTSIAAGTGISIITVTVNDYTGNPVSGATVTLSATGSGNTITQPAGPTDANGVATGSLTATAAGSKTVMAVADGVTLGQQPIVTVSAGQADPGASSVSANPDSITAGSAPSTITVTVRDGFGNPVSGSIVSLTATGSDNSLIQPAGPTNTSGVATGTLGSTVAETKNVSATADGVAIAQGTTVTVTPAPAGAIAHTLLTFGNNTVNQKIYPTAAITPGPNTLVTVAVLSHRSSGAISPTISGGGMSAWEQVASVDFDTLGFPLRRMTIFRAMSALPGSGLITISFSANVSNCQWIVSQWDGVETGGVNGAGAIVQTGSNRANAVNGLTVTLGAFGSANNVAYGVFGVNKNVPAITPGAGFTKIDEQPSGENTPGDLLAEWMTNNTAISATWTNLRGGALGVEIKARTSP